MAHSDKTFTSDHAVSRAGIADTWAVLRDVMLPTLAKGPLIRRRPVVARAERHRLDDRAVARLQALRDRHGPGPLELRIPFRRQAVILCAEDARRILAAAPEPFAPATREKRAALGHFQPAGVLSSQGHDRVIRRRLNEDVLETGCPVHSMAPRFAAMAEEEMAEVARIALDRGVLDWDLFFTGWYRMVRRIVLGDAARDDHAVTDMLERLRRNGNLAFLWPKDRALRRRFLDRLRDYLDRADPDALAGRMAAACTDPAQMPHHQLPQYLFAFDPGGMASFRTLAMLAIHPEIEAEARDQIRAAGDDPAARLPLLRAAFLDVLRLWPTTPAILRETTRDVAWGRGELRAGTQVLIFAPLHHRDDRVLEQAHRFDPGLWGQGPDRPDLGLLPFSHGPGICPASRFVPMVAGFALRALLSRMRLDLHPDQRPKRTRLPGTLDPYALGFAASPA